jgi:hypothetical protein
MVFLRYSDHLKALSTDAIDKLGALDLHWLYGSHDREEERGKCKEHMFNLLRGQIEVKSTFARLEAYRRHGFAP